MCQYYNFMAKKKKKPPVHGRIIASLRMLWLKSELRAGAFKKAKYKKLVGTYKNGNDKYLTFVVCKLCGFESRLEKDFQADHIEEVGGYQGSWDVFIDRLLFCSPDNIQVLCKKCHHEKTQRVKCQKTALKIL